MILQHDMGIFKVGYEMVVHFVQFIAYSTEFYYGEVYLSDPQLFYSVQMIHDYAKVFLEEFMLRSNRIDQQLHVSEADSCTRRF